MITKSALYRRAFEDARAAFLQGMARHRKKRTLRELANNCYISPSRMGGLLKGNGGTSMSTILDLAAYLGVSPAVFFPRGKE